MTTFFHLMRFRHDIVCYYLLRIANRHEERREMKKPEKLLVDKNFRPASIETGDEVFPNGIFVFNITKLLSFIHQNKSIVDIELIRVKWRIIVTRKIPITSNS